MKKIILILLCTLLLIITTGCAKEKVEIGPESDKVIEDKGISLIVKKDTIAKDNATFILTNDTDEFIIYGSDYELEVFKDRKWHQFNVELDFNAIGYILNPHEKKEIEINWENAYLNLKAGKYRLIKSVTFESQTGENYKGSFYVSAEFEI